MIYHHELFKFRSVSIINLAKETIIPEKLELIAYSHTCQSIRQTVGVLPSFPPSLSLSANQDRVPTRLKEITSI